MKIKAAPIGLLLLTVLVSGCGTEPAATTLVPAPTAATSALSPTSAATAGSAATATVPSVAVSPATATGTDTAPTTASLPTSAATATTGPSATGEDTTPKVVAAVEAFLATLDNSQRKSVQFAWTDTAQKQRWSNLPQGAYQRAGVMWGDLTDAQKQAWLTVMSTTLSKEGYTRVMAEWNADDQLVSQSGGGGGGGLTFGSKYYWIAIIGTPSATSPWQWQWGGHHVTVNATIVGSNIALTPSFIGCQPCEYTDANGTTVRPLGDISDEAFALVNSLDTTEQAKAVLGSNYIDLVLGPGQDGKTIQSEGLPASAMTADQQAALLKLIGHYAGLVNDEDAAVRMADIKAHLAETTFAWYGPTTKGSAAYFRITGPTLVIEYAPQQMGGNAANHIHGIYRDPTNDYGAALQK